MPDNITAEIRAWTLHREGPYKICWGEIYGDTKQRWPDGRYFHTSIIKHTKETPDSFIITTLNSIYELKKDQSFQALINKKEDNDGAGETGSSEASG